MSDSGGRPECSRPISASRWAPYAVVLRNADKLNMKIILWTNDPADFRVPGESILAERLDHGPMVRFCCFTWY